MGIVKELNRRMKDNDSKWSDDLFKEITGTKVEKLWKMYNDQLVEERG